MTPLTEADYTIVVKRSPPSKITTIFRKLDEKFTFAQKLAIALVAFCIATLVVINVLVNG